MTSNGHPTPESARPGLHLGTGYHYSAVDRSAGPKKGRPADAPLGILSAFKGSFAGTGFNTIFRPNSVSLPPNSPTPNPSILELNLTHEQLTFSAPLGAVPNRGLLTQKDITLNGVSYLQVVRDVSNTKTGLADGNPIVIHTETGFWLNVPASDVNPVQNKTTLVRLGSIPHGTTINAQGDSPDITSGGPDIGPRTITPFVIGDPGTLKPKDSQCLDKPDQPRIPKDIKPFSDAGTITQDYVNDPAKILNLINDQLDIKETATFTVSTQTSPPPSVTAQGDGLPTPDPAFPGGGTANIAFLTGGCPFKGPQTESSTGPNADAARMVSTFWVETVRSTVTVDSFQAGADALRLKPKLLKKIEGSPMPPLPTFVVNPGMDVDSPVTLDVEYTQIQYSQTVLLNFHGLSWPHVSVATLVPMEEISVDFPSS